ncbi:uncharacterized protein PGRI_006810 [Penicillium griseofulvum]|uniref:Zinc finger, HIT-type n=1 Tax=Penicillium patulum TaxID=5078 RepID=A0A135LXJ0_PENPA|nr:uncharacterized protein PGRI_006810 [Penicillium griseofulvum]KXG53631.1 hypothetical protein PGRI_006810 [Penicillium griseofulvum]
MRIVEVLDYNSTPIRGPVAKGYRFSCSLACTQSHKIYCAPKAPSNEEPSNTATDVDPTPENEANGPTPAEPSGTNATAITPAEVGASSEMKELLSQYPELRSLLQDMFQSTLEEEWVESYTPPARSRGRGRGRGRGGSAPRSRGPWTSEKGFNRGLGRVRKLRQDCEDGTETGPTAEAFMRFMALVKGKDTA